MSKVAQVFSLKIRKAFASCGDPQPGSPCVSFTPRPTLKHPFGHFI